MRDEQIVPVLLPKEARLMRLSIPSYYVVTEEGWDTQLSVLTDMGEGVALVQAMTADDPLLPLGNFQRLVGTLRGFISGAAEDGQNLGLIEVKTGKTELHARDYSACILKGLEDHSKLYYWLCCEIHEGEDFVRVSGTFREGPVTGIRASITYNDLRERGEVSIGAPEEGIIGWAADPYDPDWKIGALMNRGEDERYDEMFLTHPLTMARTLVSHFVAMN